MDFKQLILDTFSNEVVQTCLTDCQTFRKSTQYAKYFLELGKKLLQDADSHDDEVHASVWDYYAKSKSYAPNNSETLALSYFYNSALMYHLGKNEDCLKDIDRALAITSSASLKIKLLCLKAKCYTVLGDSSKISAFNEAKKIFEHEINCSDNLKDVELLVEETEKFLDKYNTIINSISVYLDNKEENKVELITEEVNNLDLIDGEIPKKKKKKKNKKETKNKKIRHRTNTSHLDILAEKETASLFSSVTLIEDLTTGYHLVANKKIMPGDIIMVSKPYCVVPSTLKVVNFCNNCLDVAWSGVPCKHCIYGMFCSEKCREEAFEKYHNIECNIINMIVSGNNYIDYLVHLSLRAVVMGVKEFNGIKELMEAVEIIDGNNDQMEMNGYDNVSKHSSFLKLLTFKNIYVNSDTLNYLAQESCKTAIIIGKFKSFFGEDCNLNSVEDCFKNDGLIFIAVLLLRVAIIACNNGIKVTEQKMRCSKNEGKDCISDRPCCERGYSINPLYQYIRHSCNPNIKSMKTDGSKEIWYALQPIAKGETLFENYRISFFEMGLSLRADINAQMLNYICDCEACKDDWPPVLAPEGDPMSYEEIFETVHESCSYSNEPNRLPNLISHYGFANQIVVDELSEIITNNFLYYGQPSTEVCAGMITLHHVFNELYGLKLIFPESCCN